MAYTSDVIVVGLGGLGSAACHHLATRGLRVVGVDQFQPAHARGASHGETRGVWQAYFMGPGYVPFLQRAYELWDHLAELRGEPFFHRTGGICLGPADGELVPAALASAKTCGLPHEYLDAAEVRRRFPTFTPAEDDVAVFDLAYAREATPLLRDAHARGLVGIDGRHMLVHQGAIAFERFTGEKAPLDVMGRACGLA